MMINTIGQEQAMGMGQAPVQKTPPTLSEILKGAHAEALKRIETDTKKVEVIMKTLEIIERLPSTDREFVDKSLSRVYS